MKQFEYNECEKGKLLCLTTLNKAESLLCKFEEGSKLFARITYHSDYLMTVVDQNKNRHTFLGKWFEETKDEFHGKPSFFNPDGIIVKLQKVDSSELPFWFKVKNYFGWF
jgi:hypothetical protein